MKTKNTNEGCWRYRRQVPSQDLKGPKTRTNISMKNKSLNEGFVRYRRQLLSQDLKQEQKSQ